MAAEPEPIDQPTVVPAADPAELPTTGFPASAEETAPTPAPPGYEILGELGRGGMGVVYQARQTALNRVVALKMILAGGHAGAELRQRFLAEAQAVARLRHPNIVQVHDLGEHDGKPYFALEFVAGGSLDKHLAGTPLPPREAAALVATLAEAMQHAHEQGIVHRDLKPANVLVEGAEPNPPGPPSLRGKGGDPLGNVAEISPTFPVRTPPFPLREGGPGGLGLARPKVMDFGLAKLLDQDSGQTKTGAIMGTPSYMAPEQAQGRKDVGPLADVYALGAILYECLTGRPPFKAATPFDTVMQVMEQEPVPPTQLQPTTPRDLETIALKCLAKEPGRRYPSARALAEDLRRYLAGEPIAARPATVLERTGKWVRRNRAVTGAAAGIVAALTLGLGLALWQAWRADAEAERATSEAGRANGEAQRAQTAEQTVRLRATALATEKARAEKQLGRAEGLLYTSRLADVERFLAEGRPDVAFGHLTDCNWMLRGWEHNRLWTRFHREGLVLRGPTNGVQAVAFSPDGFHLIGAGYDKTVRQWDVRTGEQVTMANLRGLTAQVNAMAFSPDSRRLATANEDRTARLWDTRTGELLAELKGAAGAVEAVVFSPDGARLVTTGEDRTLGLWDGRTGGKLTELEGQHRGGVRAVAFSPDGARLATGSDDQTVRLINAHTGAAIAEWRGHTDEVLAVAFSPGGPRAATGSADKTVRLWNTSTGESLVELKGHQAGVWAVVFSPDGNRLATASFDGTVRLWDVRTGQPLAHFQGHAGKVLALAFSPDGARLASGSMDKTIRLWDIRTQITFTELKGQAFGGASVAFSPEGTRLATACGEKTVRLWDVRTWAPVLELTGHEYPVISVGFSSDGAGMATASVDGTARLWDAHTGAAGAELKGHWGRVNALVYSPDGARLATTSQDRTVRLWNPHTAASLAVLKGHTGSVNSVAFSPDGTRLATGSGDRTVRLWDTRTLKSRLEIKGHTDSVRAVTFSPDGSKLATGSMDQTVRLWDVRTGTVLAELRGHTGGVRTVAFSPDGTRLASGSMDQTVRLWDPHTGAALAELSGHNHWVSAMTFSPDGTRLATGSMDGGIRLWDAHLRPGALVLKGTKTVVAAVAFGPDGTRLLARDDTGALYAWDRTTGYPLDETEPLPANATAEATTPDGKYRLFILGGQAYYAETARWQEHLREEAARWAEQSRPRPDWHRDQAAKAAAAGQWFAAAFHHRQLARHLADQGDAAGAVAQTKAADALRVRHAVIPETPQPLTKP